MTNEGIKMEQKFEIEKSRAILQLAQILMILAGFLFATGGIVYTNSVAVLSTSLPLLNNDVLELNKMNKSNVSTEEMSLFNDVIKSDTIYLNSVFPQLDLMKALFCCGFTLAFISLSVWVFGYWKIDRLKN